MESQQKKRIQEKFKWTVLLFIAFVLFIIALKTQFIPFNIFVIGLALYIYKYGNPILFKEYDDKRKKKVEEGKIIQNAAKEAILSKKIFKK